MKSSFKEAKDTSQDPQPRAMLKPTFKVMIGFGALMACEFCSTISLQQSWCERRFSLAPLRTEKDRTAAFRTEVLVQSPLLQH